MIETHETYSLSIVFFLVLCLYSALEVISLRRIRFVRILLAGGHGPEARAPSHLPDKQMRAAPIFIAFGSALSFFASEQVLTISAATALLVGNLLMFNGMRFGQEGADHIRLYAGVFFFVSSIWSLVEPEQAKRIFLLLVAALTVGFYFGSALVKAVEPSWWSGEGLIRALSTNLYGHQVLLSLLCAVPNAARFLSVGLILWELTFPLAIFLAGKYVLAWMVVGLVFHLSVAIFMRLPLFLLSVGVMYPATYWTSLSLY
ncbi:hypothetical protein [Agrobacterium burrii]|uniref:HTTM domain-containing protein n=1 Tax=Agrobacterium burrii TaxID=2815339 RepID=A0ABS3ESA1_9HYPH|nr:hypothetical protein [Agrobacterium burrii]MBO0134622.1 hypothetical protein [Agrobacterium burrii]